MYARVVTAIVINSWHYYVEAFFESEAIRDSPLDGLAEKIETIDRLSDEVILKLKRASI